MPKLVECRLCDGDGYVCSNCEATVSQCKCQHLASATCDACDGVGLVPTDKAVMHAILNTSDDDVLAGKWPDIVRKYGRTER